LTQNYLQWYYISQLKDVVTSPNNSTIILPYDQRLTPLLNIQGNKKQ
jgi:prohibitin 1